jgi:translation initiation factor IF-2
MSEIKLPRLLPAAKEFNIGRDTLIDFLVKKGFNKEELKDTAKLSVEMYNALQSEFSSDKAAKDKADKVEIPKSNIEQKRKRDEEDLSIHKKNAQKHVVATPAPVAPVVVEEVIKPVEVVVPQAPIVVVEEIAKPEIKIVEEPAPVAIVEEKPIVIQPKIEVEKTIEITIPVVVEKAIEEVAAIKPEEVEITKIAAPELEGPKILSKIDLSSIDSSTKPRKGVKPVSKPIVAAPAQVIKPTVAPTIVAPVVAKIVNENKDITIEIPKASTGVPEAEVENTSRTISNIEVEKLTGPKILGKIELPKDNDTRPKPPSKEDLRKRKRTPIDKKGTNIQHVDFRKDDRGGNNQQQGGGFNRPPGTGQQQGGGFNRPPGTGQQQGGGYNRGGPGGNNRPGGGYNRPDVRAADKEIDKKEIQDKIKETQARLAGNSGKNRNSAKARNRRDKRREAAESMSDEERSNVLQVTEFVTVSELANLMDVGFTDVISKCMGLGIMVSINQRLDAEVIELVASEFNYEVEFTSLDDLTEDDEDEDVEDPADRTTRAPIVTIMGHVDHGKTSLLDYIRSANVVAGEAGGITQHIGAYEVTLPGTDKHITFLDTPGHEAFTAMRARGAKVTDIAVIVVAADDAVMPQTKEAISHAQAASVPMIFAVNKIDRDGSNPQKIYEQLSQMNILVEEWGGKFQSQELSAKKGINVDLLLEKILLEAELLDLKANSKREASGTIIEASLDKGRGYVATILVQDGTLKQGDLVVSGQYYGRVKAMFNERNVRVQDAPPSTPVVILGLSGAPQAGEKFKVYADEAQAKEVAIKRSQIFREQGLRARKHITLDEIGRRLALGNFKELNIIIKGDVDGSVEALSDSLQKLSTPEVAIKVVLKAVGQISESDVLLAAASDAILIGFNVRPSSQANKLAENEGVQIKQYSIIYKAIEEIKAAMEGMLEPKVEEKEVATVEIREVFKFDKATVAGCYVTEGKIKRDHKIKVFRDGILVYPRQEGGYAELASLKRFKDDMKEVASNYECGLTIKGFIDIQAGDTVVAYEEETVKRTL